MTVGWLEGYLQEVHWRSVRGIYCNHMCFLDGVEGPWSHLKQKLKISQSLSKVHVRCSLFYVSVTNWLMGLYLSFPTDPLM